MNPTLSVIIPVYKVEAYLERCVNSVLNQDYRDLEVILVDDGSPDKCPQICDEFAAKDNRVSVIHKPNGGLSSARNAGIEKAKGKYIAFLDSDDQWAEGKLKPLIERLQLESPDMVAFCSFELRADGSLKKRDKTKIEEECWRNLSKMEYYEEVICCGNLRESACTKIFDLNFLRNHSLFFKEGITGEDTEWMFRILRVANKISISSIHLFICTNGRVGSISNSISLRNVNDLLETINCSIEYYKIHPNSNTKTCELTHCSYLWCSCLAFAASLPKSEYREVSYKLKSIIKNLDLKSHPKSKKVAIIYKMAGFRITSVILKFYLYLHKRNIVNRKVSIK